MRFVVLAAVVLAAVIGAFLLAPIPQDPAYHLFADGRGKHHGHEDDEPHDLPTTS